MLESLFVQIEYVFELTINKKDSIHVLCNVDIVFIKIVAIYMTN